jgi:hypothetical protein
MFGPGILLRSFAVFEDVVTACLTGVVEVLAGEVTVFDQERWVRVVRF